MANRVDRLHHQLRATAHLLGWFGVIAATTLVAAIACAGQAPQTDEGLLLRPGEWRQEVGSYLLPADLQGAPVHWPVDGWYRVTHRPGALDVRAVKAPSHGLPPFLADIASQVVRPAGTMVADEAEMVDTQYIRVPGLKLREGRLATVKFGNGVLRPQLDHTYALQLGEQPFTLTVRNGLRNAAGVAYGEGAQYVIGYGGQTYSYQLGQFGWASTVQAIADLDGDGRPDLLIQVDGSNSSDEYLLLSSRARPGPNPPTATLSAQGC